MADGALVGRQAERERLETALAAARGGLGGVVLVAGDAGIGKTRLVAELAGSADGPVLPGRAVPGVEEPYGPVVGALRALLRARPGALDDVGPLGAHLALLLPELGPPAPAGDRATLVEAVRAALATAAGDGHALLLLEDLHWSDEATLDLLASLADPLATMPVLVVATHRTDGVGRDHPLRRLRDELRRAGRLQELALAPLAPGETGELLAELLGQPAAPGLARMIHERTQGVPFFVEELARALVASGWLTDGPEGPDVAADREVPLPETIRDAILMGASHLSPAARAAAEAAAVAGESVDLDLLAEIAGVEGIAELAGAGLIAEDGEGSAAFRHSLTREAFLAGVPWLGRRDLHRRIATALEARGARAAEVAVHWLGARDEARGRDALLRAAEESRAVHAHRDAARVGRRALELWPDGEDPERRIETLASYAASSELSGDLAEAARAWREICAVRTSHGSQAQLAGAQRRLAAVHDLLGEAEAAAAARRGAAEAFAAAGRPGDAAAERLALALHHESLAAHTAAGAAALAARGEARTAGRADLVARAMGIEGMALARGGDPDGGLRVVEDGLALALENGVTAVAAELYQRLGVVLYNTSDYRGAEGPLGTALGLCRGGEAPATEVETLVCLVYVLRESGEWPRALELADEMVATDTGRWFAEGLTGAVHGFQGRLGRARRMLESSLGAATRAGHYYLTVDITSGLAWVAAAAGADDEAAALCRSLLERWRAAEDHHYAVAGLRWSAGFLARRGALEDAHAAAAALSAIAAGTGRPDALAALAHAIGETALAEGDAATAAAQFARALELHRGLDVPFERAQIQLRAGVADAATGERARAVERLQGAYRTARRLRAAPLAAEAAREMGALGEPVERRLGRRAAARAGGGAALSRRELEVVRLVAAGHTNREIAHDLYLSPRTVDMHVSNLLRKLGSRSRTDAARRAGELGLLAPAAGDG